MSTTSNVNSIGGIQSLEQAQAKKLFEGGNQTLGQDTFLRLLTTQLQHQNPLNPMDNSQFVAQLSQFSSLEQLTTVNDNLISLATGMSSVGSATMVNLIGKEVRAVGDGFHYETGDKELHYKLDGAADKATVTVYDKDGNVVFQDALSQQKAGDGTYTWDGKTVSGNPAAPGDYTFRITATSENEAVGVTTYTQGFVDQIDFSGGVAAPRVDGQTLTVDKIVQILENQKPAGAAAE